MRKGEKEVHIVLVDNNASDLSMLADQIKKLLPKYQIHTFSDPLMSAKYIYNNEVALAFLSYEMRPVDGFILLRTLRTNKPSLPVVMMINNELQRETALRETLGGCLTKPISTELLAETLERIPLDRITPP